jgi:hypothetical protein
MVRSTIDQYRNSAALLRITYCHIMINQQYLQFVQGQLAQFAAQDNFESIIFTAFGDRVDLLLLQDLRQQWLAGDS